MICMDLLLERFGSFLVTVFVRVELNILEISTNKII